MTASSLLMQLRPSAAGIKGLGDELAWWVPTHDDQNVGSMTLGDFGSGGNPGTLTNMVAGDWVADTTAGGVRCLNFDGVDSTVITTSVDLSVAAVTIAFWAKINFAATSAIIVEFSANLNDQTDAFALATTTGSQLDLTLKGIGYNNALYSEPADDSWNHYVLMLDKSEPVNEVNLYLNGSLQTPASRPNTSNTTGTFGDHPFYFMSRGNVSLYRDGRTDDIRIFNRVLTASEVSHLASARGVLGPAP